jgi:hypothetical protein
MLTSICATSARASALRDRRFRPATRAASNSYGTVRVPGMDDDVQPHASNRVQGCGILVRLVCNMR